MLGLEARRWGATAWLSATGHVGESRLFLIDYAIRALRVAVLASIWTMLVAADPDASPLPLAALLSWVVLAEGFAQLIALESGLAQAFWQGTLVHYFLRPTGVARQFAAEGAGRALIDFVLFSLPLFAIAPLFGVSLAPASGAAGWLFPLSLALSLAVGLALEFVGGALALWSDQPIWLIDNARRTLVQLLSGALVPLAVLPWGLGDALAWLPFAATAWAPLALYGGLEAAPRLLALQLGWALALWTLALALWRGGRERVVAYGG